MCSVIAAPLAFGDRPDVADYSRRFLRTQFERRGGQRGVVALPVMYPLGVFLKGGSVFLAAVVRDTVLVVASVCSGKVLASCPNGSFSSRRVRVAVDCTFTGGATSKFLLL